MLTSSGNRSTVGPAADCQSLVPRWTRVLPDPEGVTRLAVIHVKFSIKPDGPFSLAAAEAFGFGPNTSPPKPADDGMRLAFVTDDMCHYAGAHVLQGADGTVTVTVETDADQDAIRRQVCRILSLDHSGTEWAAVGTRDPVIGGLQREHPGLRPVLFHSPYEAAAWSIISARRPPGQAAAIRTRIAAELGRTFTIAGKEVHAFPLPQRLLDSSEIRSVAPLRLQWLHSAARAALDGSLKPQALAALEPDEALGQLQRLPGIGPAYATLILVRASGAGDVITFNEPRLPGYVSHFYGLGAEPASREQLDSIADGWRPLRTWAAVLIRVAGDRLGLHQPKAQAAAA
jgi:DNA-3-methyladenine glycosylase II